MTEEEESDVPNQRQFKRRRTLFGGSIYRGSESWDCSISDISESGVRVKTEAELEIGDVVELKNNKFNDIREAEVVWKREGFLGLNFLVKIDTTRKEVAEFFKMIRG